MLKGFVGISMLLLIVASVFVPVDIPYAFETTAKVYPLQQWMLLKQTDGSLVSTLHNYKSGLLRDYSSYQFDRGDVVNIKFHSNQISPMTVDSGQLIASINSNMLASNLIQLENEKTIESAKLLQEQAGQKPEIVSRQKEEIRLAENSLDIKTKQFNRNKELYDQGLIAYTTLEISENAFKQAQAELVVARERVQVVSTGQRPEDINYIKAKIASIDKEIAFLKTTNQNYDLYSPISGRITYESNSQGDKLIIEDTTQHILYIPIRLRDRDFITKESTIDLKIMGQDSLVQADFIGINDKVEILGRNVVVLAKAMVKGDVEGLATGMPISCKITCGKIKPMEYMKRSIKVDLR